MFNQSVGSLRPDILEKLETRLAAAKKRLLEVQALKPDDKAAIWIVARKVYDIEKEIDAWRKVQ